VAEIIVDVNGCGRSDHEGFGDRLAMADGTSVVAIVKATDVMIGVEYPLLG
jgi:hypothetical protein